MYKYYNPNPDHRNVGDCAVRAICKATGDDWETVFAALSAQAFYMRDMPSANHVWGSYLRRLGYTRHLVDDNGIDEYTVIDFCEDNPHGTFVLGVQGHAVCVENGHYFDSRDSGREVPVYYWRKNGAPGNVE